MLYSWLYILYIAECLCQSQSIPLPLIPWVLCFGWFQLISRGRPGIEVQRVTPHSQSPPEAHEDGENQPQPLGSRFLKVNSSHYYPNLCPSKSWKLSSLYPVRSSQCSEFSLSSDHMCHKFSSVQFSCSVMSDSL